MTWPAQNTTNESNAGAFLVSSAIAAGITNISTLSQLGQLQEIVANLLNDIPTTVTINLSSAILTSSSIKSSGTAGVGYAAGAGGLITQASNKTTAVVLNKICGAVLTNNAELLPGAEATFTVTNTTVVATDVVLVNPGGAGSTGKYIAAANNIAAGAFDITLSNVSAVSLTEAVTVNFAIIKGVQA